jgi:DNA repair exonuclease SbcCD nuclease subunit
MNIIHTADLHLKNTATPEGARRLRVLGEICALARERDALVIAGDLFDSAAEARSLESQLRKLFTDIYPVSVFIIPGNHDFLRGDNPFDGRLDFGQGRNIKIFCQAPFETAAIRRAVFYGVPFRKSASTTELLKTAGSRSQSEIKIAIMHGTSMDRHELSGWAFDAENAEEGGDLIIKDADLRAGGFSYAALGHIHRAAQWTTGECLFSYPGSPDAIRVTESDKHTVNAVTIDEETGHAELERLPLASACSALREYVFVFPGDEAILSDRLNAAIANNSKGKLLNFVIEGIADINRVKDALAAVRMQWSGQLDIEPQFNLRVEDMQPRSASMIMYTFLRKTRELAAEANTPERRDMVRRITSLGWRTLTGRATDPGEMIGS